MLKALWDGIVKVWVMSVLVGIMSILVGMLGMLVVYVPLVSVWFFLGYPMAEFMLWLALAVGGASVLVSVWLLYFWEVGDVRPQG